MAVPMVLPRKSSGLAMPLSRRAISEWMSPELTVAQTAEIVGAGEDFVDQDKLGAAGKFQPACPDFPGRISPGGIRFYGEIQTLMFIEPLTFGHEQQAVHAVGMSADGNFFQRCSGEPAGLPTIDDTEGDENNGGRDDGRKVRLLMSAWA